MKKIILIVLVAAIGSIQNSFAQNTSLLPLYFDMKDALVADNSALAATKAGEFVKEFTTVDFSKLSQNDHDALLKGATHISESKDIKHQREHFAAFSNSMIALAKVTKLSPQPVYQLYCPMKKSSWLSNEKSVKNPYYGKAMLTCGSVTKTLN